MKDLTVDPEGETGKVPATDAADAETTAETAAEKAEEEHIMIGRDCQRIQRKLKSCSTRS